jgi:predicted solute-binding protein
VTRIVPPEGMKGEGPLMQYEFDEKIDQAIQKSVKAALRQLKERQRLAQESGGSQTPPSYEEFARVVDEFMESNKRADMSKMRTPSLRELFDRAWGQKLRNYAVQRELRDAYEALLRRY